MASGRRWPTRFRSRWLVLWALLAILSASGAGCGMFSASREENRQPQTVPEWMKQKRPGNGVIGP